ncbi:MAG TPA: efflux RND transporter periplasmic adaptor subunit, partial [Polyangiaceae bacterium]
MTEVVRKDMPIEVRTVGTAEAVSTVQVIPQVGGLVQQVHFKEGDFVKKGDLLFTIDTRPYQASLSAAQAELEKSRALADQAHQELARFESLAREGVATQVDLSQKRANAAALDATLGANRAAIVGSSINVQYAAIRSPIDGRTGSLLVHAGNVVRATDARSLVVIRTIQPIYVRFAVPEQFLPKIRAATQKGPVVVEAKPRGADGDAAGGTLTFIENSVDPTSGKIDMKGEFRNDGQILWPGQLVDVMVRLGVEKDALVVPEFAVQTGQEGAYTFVVGANMLAELR